MADPSESEAVSQPILDLALPLQRLGCDSQQDFYLDSATSVEVAVAVESQAADAYRKLTPTQQGCRAGV
jgi:hypothetical protein